MAVGGHQWALAQEEHGMITWCAYKSSYASRNTKLMRIEDGSSILIVCVNVNVVEQWLRMS